MGQVNSAEAENLGSTSEEEMLLLIETVIEDSGRKQSISSSEKVSFTEMDQLYFQRQWTILL